MKINVLIAAGIVISATFMYACSEGNGKVETTADSVHHDDASASHEHISSGNEEHDHMMKKMMDDMNAMKMAADVDLDFANMMIPHHQSAVDMAKSYLPKAKDEKIKSMAQNIINDQNKEIADLKRLIASHKIEEVKGEIPSPGEVSEGHNELLNAMNKMMEKMKGIQLTGDRDKDFVMMMIPHHQSAVEMADKEISHGKDVEIKAFAQKMISSQSREVKEFEQWLNSK